MSTFEESSNGLNRLSGSQGQSITRLLLETCKRHHFSSGLTSVDCTERNCSPSCTENSGSFGSSTCLSDLCKICPNGTSPRLGISQIRLSNLFGIQYHIQGTHMINNIRWRSLCDQSQVKCSNRID